MWVVERGWSLESCVVGENIFIYAIHYFRFSLCLIIFWRTTINAHFNHALTSSLFSIARLLLEMGVDDIQFLILTAWALISTGAYQSLYEEHFLMSRNYMGGVLYFIMGRLRSKCIILPFGSSRIMIYYFCLHNQKGQPIHWSIMLKLCFNLASMPHANYKLAWFDNDQSSMAHGPCLFRLVGILLAQHSFCAEVIGWLYSMDETFQNLNHA